MTWISFAIVALIFYAPVVGLSTILRLQPTELFLYSLVVWILVSLVLLAIETIFHPDLLDKVNLRNGLVYSLRPYLTNNIVRWLAIVILIYTIAKFCVGLAGLGALFPYDFDAEVIVLATFALISVAAFGLEQRIRYLQDIRRNQRHRKALWMARRD